MSPAQPPAQASPNVIRGTTPQSTVVRASSVKQVRSIRLTDAGRQRIADRAARADVDFSHMVRRMLAYADRHMPDGWVPPLTSNRDSRP